MLHRYFEHFKAVVETGSILQASHKLYIAQPALSRSIKLLEEQLGIQLFIRKNKGVELTEYGRVLYQQVCSMEHEFQYALDEIDYMKNQKRLSLRIGSGIVWQYGVFPDAVNSFRQRFPDVQLQVVTGFSHLLYDQFLRSEFDIIFCDIGNLQPVTGVVFEHLMNVCFSFFAAWNHPLFEKATVEEQDLLEHEFAVFSHTNLASVIDMDDDHQFSKHYLRKVRYISGSMINLLEVVSTTQYITSLPEYIHHIAEQFGLKEIHPDMRRASFPSGMVYREAALNKPLIREYIDCIRSSVQSEPTHSNPRV